MTSITFPFDTETHFRKWTKVRDLPKNDFEKQAILIKLLEEFKDGIIYAEPEVNEILKKYFDDYALLRREMINFSYMQRDPQKATYWVVKRTLTQEDIDRNTLLRKHAKAYGY